MGVTISPILVRCGYSYATFFRSQKYVDGIIFTFCNNGIKYIVNHFNKHDEHILFTKKLRKIKTFWWVPFVNSKFIRTY